MKTTPCMLNPAGWDLDVDAATRAARVPVAVAACDVCPLREPCLAEAEQDRPLHYCVWGALVYPGNGKAGQKLADWLVGNPPPPATVECPGCGATVPAAPLYRRYCTRRCYHTAYGRRRRHAARNGPRKCLPATVRVEQVRQLLADGLDVEEIADRLNLGVKSIRNYRAVVAG